MKVSNLNPNILILETVGKDFRITVDWTPSKIKTEWITPKTVKNPLRGLNEKQKPSIYGLYGKRVSFKVDVGCGMKKHKTTRHGSHARRELQLSPGRIEINNRDGGIELRDEGSKELVLDTIDARL